MGSNFGSLFLLQFVIGIGIFQAKKASRISVIGCEEELQDLKRLLEEETALRKQVERELELQVGSLHTLPRFLLIDP